MGFRDGAYTVIGEKFCLVEHAAEQAFHPVAAQERKQAALAATGLIPPRDKLCEVRPVIQEPSEPLSEFRGLFKALGFENLNGVKRIKPTIERTFSGTMRPSGRFRTS